MRNFIEARFLIASDTFVAVAEKTPAEASARWQELVARNEVTSDGLDVTPRLALVDDVDAPSAWAFVREYYRIRHCDKAHTDAGAYHVGEGNLFEERDAAIKAACALDDLGDEWDVCVVAFDDVTGSGRVTWGA